MTVWAKEDDDKHDPTEKIVIYGRVDDALATYDLLWTQVMVTKGLAIEQPKANGGEEGSAIVCLAKRRRRLPIFQRSRVIGQPFADSVPSLQGSITMFLLQY